MGLESVNGEERFSVFMRKNFHFAENFTIGLIYHSVDLRPFTLFRCNGPHKTIVSVNEPHEHYLYHIHIADANCIRDGNLNPKAVSKTDAYASYEEAFAFFVARVGIVDAKEYFPELSSQLSLFGGEIEQ